MNLVSFLIAFAMGCVLPLQAAINATLRTPLGGSTLQAAFVSFAIGTAALALVFTAMGQPWSALAGLAQTRPWQLTGGLLGAFFVFGSTLLAPRIGLAAMVSLIVAGQLCASLAYDRFGLLGIAARELSAARAVGALLIAIGVLVMNFGDRLMR